ncbi:TrbC/VirB2 family protein [Achromobacter spanius]|uniref:TrbC/VirB2 family protein n=1 Tax=Achromobacter spanius TaxID=217203 RepID=UPI0038308896
MTNQLNAAALAAPSAVQVGTRMARVPTFFLAFLALIALVLVPELAHAEPWDQGANWLVEALQNGFIRSCAIVGVIGVGLAALGGHIPWKWAIAIIGSVVLMFGAPVIVDGIIGAVS